MSEVKKNWAYIFWSGKPIFSPKSWNKHIIFSVTLLHAFSVYMAIGLAANHRSFITCSICDQPVCGHFGWCYKSFEHYTRATRRWWPIQMRCEQFNGKHRVFESTQRLWWVEGHYYHLSFLFPHFKIPHWKTMYFLETSLSKSSIYFF